MRFVSCESFGNCGIVQRMKERENAKEKTSDSLASSRRSNAHMRLTEEKNLHSLFIP